jgi:hypothetical protein
MLHNTFSDDIIYSRELPKFERDILRYINPHHFEIDMDVWKHEFGFRDYN